MIYIFFTAALTYTKNISAGSKKYRRTKKASAYAISRSSANPANAAATPSANDSDAQPTDECATTSSSRNVEADIMVPSTGHSIAADVLSSDGANDEADDPSVL